MNFAWGALGVNWGDIGGVFSEAQQLRMECRIQAAIRIVCVLGSKASERYALQAPAHGLQMRVLPVLKESGISPPNRTRRYVQLASFAGALALHLVFLQVPFKHLQQACPHLAQTAQESADLSKVGEAEILIEPSQCWFRYKERKDAKASRHLAKTVVGTTAEKLVQARVLEDCARMLAKEQEWR